MDVKKLEAMEISERIKVLKEINEKILSILRKPTYTEQDKQAIINYVTEGIYKETVDTAIDDETIRKMVLEIRQEYRYNIGKKDISLNTIYADNKMFITIRNAMSRVIDNGEGKYTPEQYISLVNDFATQVVDMGSNASLRRIEKIRKYMTPEEFLKSPAHKKVIIDFRAMMKRNGEDKETQLLVYREYTSRYIDYLVLNGLQVDLENDELLNEYNEEDKANFQEEIKKKIKLREILINGQVSTTSPRDLEEASRYVLEMLGTPFYIDYIKAYVEKGFYNRLIEIGIENSKTRDLILNLLEKYNYNIGKKDISLSTIFAMFNTIKGAIESVIDTGENNITSDEYINLINDYVLRLVSVEKGNTLEKVAKVHKYITPKEFNKSEAYKRIVNRLKKVMEEDDKSSLLRYKQYIKSYIEFLHSKCTQIDIENDELLSLGMSFDKKMILGQKILLEDDEKRQYDDEELICVNTFIATLLEDTFEQKKYLLSEQDKKYIEKYFSNYFEQSMNDINSHKEIIPVIEYLTKIKRFSLHGREKDAQFIKKFYENDLKLRIEENIDIAEIENGNIHDTDALEQILKLLASESLETTKTLRTCFKALEQNGIDVNHSAEMKAYIEHFIDVSSTSKIEPTKDEIFEFVYEYIDSITKDKASFNIFEEQGISDILQLVYANKLPKEQADKILAILEKNLSISEIDVSETSKEINEFIKENKNSAVDSEQKFDEFLALVQNMKLANSLKLDSRTIDFIIKQTLNSNSVIYKNPEKYQSVVERTLEDLARNDLSEKVKGYSYFIRDILERRTINGIHNSKRGVLYKRELIDNFIRNKDLKILDTIFHENTHAEQNYDIKYGTYDNYTRYTMDKEDIIREYNSEYYIANYELMFEEIEAREKAARKLSSFLDRLGLDKSEKFIYDSLIQKDITAFLQQLAQSEKGNYERGAEKLEKISSTKKEKVTDYFDRLVARNPNILNGHPKLKIEYNADGSLKRIKDVLPEISKLDDNRGRILYRNILKKGNIFKRELLAEDLDSLMEFKSDDIGTSTTVALIISDNVGRMIEEVLTNVDKMSVEEIKRLQESFRKAQEYMNLGEKSTFSSGMKRKSRESLQGETPWELMKKAEEVLANKVLTVAVRTEDKLYQEEKAERAIDSPEDTIMFSEDEIGKATVNVPITQKDESKKKIQIAEKTLDELQEVKQQ